MAETVIYINDSRGDAVYNTNPQAYRLACAVRDALTERIQMPEYVRVYTPNKANVDLLHNNQYRIVVRVYGCEGAILVSGELVEQPNPRQLGTHLAGMIWREVSALLPTPPPPTP